MRSKREEKIDKHYVISKNVIERLKRMSDGRFTTETKAVEYFLVMGMNNFDNYNKEIKIFNTIEKTSGEIRYIKKLLKQLFVNKDFKVNKDINKDDMLKEFDKKYLKIDLND